MAKDEQDKLEARFAELAEQNAQLRALLEAKLEAAPRTADLSREDFLTGLSVAMKEATKGTEAFASQQMPSRPDHLNPRLGPFEHPEGGLAHPKPLLAREVWFAGARVRDAEATYAEVIAINALSATLSRAQRRICRDGKWKAMVSDDDARLVISVPMKTIDDRADLPSFLNIVQELTTGKRALDPVDLENELALLKVKVAELTGVPA